MRRLFIGVLAALLAVVGLSACQWQSTLDPEVSAVPSTTTSGSASSGAGSAVDPDSGLRWVELGELPQQARETLGLIDAGGPFPYRKDGSTFRNAERLLPSQRRGYYREYTVDTPGSRDRGARRIVTGERGEYYWTDDHYRSFRRIRR